MGASCKLPVSIREHIGRAGPSDKLTGGINDKPRRRRRQKEYADNVGSKRADCALPRRPDARDRRPDTPWPHRPQQSVTDNGAAAVGDSNSGHGYVTIFAGSQAERRARDRIVDLINMG